MRQILVLINLKTIIITALAVLSTYLCIRFGIVAEFPMTLIATAVVFPIVFSINGAYKRRESALSRYSSIKAHGRGIFFAARDWLEATTPEIQEKGRRLLGELMQSIRKLFSEPSDRMPENEKAVYQRFSALSLYIRDDLRGNGLASGEVSRCNQFLSKMLIAFEDAKHIYQYRTPQTLRGFSDFFVKVLPVMYGPYFASLAADFTQGLGYVMPVLFSVILVSLDNIQSHLENPYDNIGHDDITINAEKFVERLAA